MADPKKLVPFFLILSSIVGSVLFVAPNFFPSGTKEKGLPEVIATKENAREIGSVVKENAFVENLPEGRKVVLPGNNGLPPIFETDNITEDLAQNLTREILEAGKTAPQASGEFVPPTDDEITAEIAARVFSPESLLKIDLPKFTPNISDESLKLSTDNSPEALTRYAEGVRRILGKTILSGQFENLILARTPTEASLPSARKTHSEAFRELSALQTPVVFKDLHASLLTLVLNRKTFADIPNTESQDPARTLLLVESLSDKISSILSADVGRLAAEVKNLEAKGISLAPPARSALATLVESFFPTAHAIAVPINTYLDFNSISTNGSTYGTWIETIWKRVQGVLLQTLKRTLITLIEQEVVGFINTGRFGEPFFVTDWTQLVGITYDAASNSAINTISRILCTGLGAHIRAFLLPGPQYYRQGMCTLDQILRNLANPRAFYLDFSVGGFPGYYAALRDNFFLHTIQTSDAAINAGLKAATAEQNDALANGAFRSLKRCGYSTENNAAGGKPESDGLCPDGTRPTIVTPGVAAGQSLSVALGAGKDTLVNANDITELTAVIVDSALNKLIQMGINGLANMYASGAPAGTVATTNIGASTLCQPYNPETRIGLQGTQLSNCLETARRAGTVVANPTNTRPPAPTPTSPARVVNTTPETVATTTLPVIPPPIPVQCKPGSQTISRGGFPTALASFDIVRDPSGVFTGRAPYTWSAPGAATNETFGPTSRTFFNPVYSFTSERVNPDGTITIVPYQVTVRDDTGASDVCEVIVQ